MNKYKSKPKIKKIRFLNVFLVVLALASDMPKNMVIECTNSHIKKIILNSSNLFFKLEQ